MANLAYFVDPRQTGWLAGGGRNGKYKPRGAGVGKRVSISQERGRGRRATQPRHPTATHHRGISPTLFGLFTH